MPRKLNSRAAAAKLAWQIIDKGQSLDACVPNYFEESDHGAQDRGFIQELVYGVCRWYGELDWLAAQLLRSPIRNKDRVVHFVLLVGLYQLRHIETAEHAAVGETVSACKQLNKVWAKNLVNGCLRQYLRGQELSDASNTAIDRSRLSHPQWISAAIEAAWPDHTADILAANDQRPPMCLRVNRRQNSRDEYLALLAEKGLTASEDPFSVDGVILERPVPVSDLPGFTLGTCSIQDTAAQLTADFLAAEPSMTVLDACAAPGGKAAHILERTNNQLTLHALDISQRRCERLRDTLSRLRLSAQVFSADATDTSAWPVPAGGYDRILIDAPCSGLGVIRRHPDIKHHRRRSDINSLADIQQKLLLSLWPLLSPGGKLLYMTCSVLPDENVVQIQRFLASQNDAMLMAVDHPNALPQEVGVQTLPGVHGMDGFYYALLTKVDH